MVTSSPGNPRFNLSARKAARGRRRRASGTRTAQVSSRRIEPAVSPFDVDARNEREPGANQTERETPAANRRLVLNRASTCRSGCRSRSPQTRAASARTEFAGASDRPWHRLAATASTRPIAIKPSMPASVTRRGPPPIRETGIVGARENHEAAPARTGLGALRSTPAPFPETHRRDVRITKLIEGAHAGDKSTTGSSALLARASSNAAFSARSSVPVAPRQPCPRAFCRRLGCIADQIGLPHAGKYGPDRQCRFFSLASGNPEMSGKQASAREAASALVALESLTKRTLPIRRPLRGGGQDQGTSEWRKNGARCRG